MMDATLRAACARWNKADMPQSNTSQLTLHVLSSSSPLTNVRKAEPPDFTFQEII